MNRTVYLLVFEGLADWEPALAMCELRNNGVEVLTVGFTADVVTTMGGLRLQPHTPLELAPLNEAAMLILPGGEMWQTFEDEAFFQRLRDLHQRGVPIAALCGATIALARAGLLDDIRHTSNSAEFLSYYVPAYRGARYESVLAVSDKNILSASGVGYVEFAQLALEHFSIYSAEERREWFDVFKHGVNPASA